MAENEVKKYISSIFADGQKRHIKDAEARAAIDGILADYQKASDLAYEGAYNKETNKIVTKSALDTAIGAVAHLKIEVLTGSHTEVTDPKSDVIYLEPKGTGKTGYREWIYVNSAWEEIGDTEIDLSNYRTSADQDTIDNAIKGLITDEKARAEQAEGAIADKASSNTGRIAVIEEYFTDGKANTAAQADNATKAADSDKLGGKAASAYEEKANLKAMAYADTASGTVASQTIKNVKATGSVSGTATVESTATDITLNGTFTPTGTVSVTLKDAGVLASVKSAGTLPTYAHTGFSGGSLGDASSSKFVKKTINAKISSDDAECLEFFEVESTDTNFYADALTAQGTFTAAVYGTDTFTQGAMPEFNTGTVAVDAATFTGTVDQAISTSGQYDKVNGTATVTATNVSLDVGDIVVAEKTVTVNPDAKE